MSNFDILSYVAAEGLFPTHLASQINAIFKCTYVGINIENLRTILVKECKTLTQLRIAQAVIVFRIYEDPDIRDILRQADRITSWRELTKKYLGIDDSTCKLLLRIGHGLQYLPHLYEAGIDPLSNGTLDKIANFDRAQYYNGLEKAMDAFRCCNVKEF
jgi:hypothetical protein